MLNNWSERNWEWIAHRGRIFVATSGFDGRFTLLLFDDDVLLVLFVLLLLLPLPFVANLLTGSFGLLSDERLDLRAALDDDAVDEAELTFDEDLGRLLPLLVAVLPLLLLDSSDTGDLGDLGVIGLTLVLASVDDVGLPIAFLLSEFGRDFGVDVYMEDDDESEPSDRGETGGEGLWIFCCWP